MSNSTEQGARQGYTDPWRERLPLPEAAAMTAAQKAAADALIAGPRKGVFGPFLPLMQSPVLLDRVASVGEYLRFDSVVDGKLRELVTCAVARHVGNQFEWVTHAPMAEKLGVAPATIESLRLGARPTGLPDDEALALDFTNEVLLRNGVSEPTYNAAVARWGEPGVVELTTLIGYFVMVNWVMNVAHTCARPAPGVAVLPPFPL